MREIDTSGFQEGQATIRNGLRQIMEWALNDVEDEHIAEVSVAIGNVASSIIALEASASGRPPATASLASLPETSTYNIAEDAWPKRDKHLANGFEPAEILQKHGDSPNVLNSLAQFSPRFYGAIDYMVSSWGVMLKPKDISARIPVPADGPPDAAAKAFRRMIRDLKDTPLGAELHDNGLTTSLRMYWFGDLLSDMSDTDQPAVTETIPKQSVEQPAEETTAFLGQPFRRALPLSPIQRHQDPEHWSDIALCREVDPDLFYPDKGGDTSSPRAICAGCEVLTECQKEVLMISDRFGVTGGLTYPERRLLRHMELSEEELDIKLQLIGDTMRERKAGLTMAEFRILIGASSPDFDSIVTAAELEESDEFDVIPAVGD